MSDGSCCSFIYTALGNAAMGKERMELFVDGKSIVMDNFLKLTGYGFPLSFNRKVNVQDRGHKQLLAKFFEAAQNKNIPAPITHERILTATAISLVVDRLARAGGGFESI